MKIPSSFETTECDSTKTDSPLAEFCLNSTFKNIFLFAAAFPLASLATDCIAIPLGIEPGADCPNKSCTAIISNTINDILKTSENYSY